MYGSYTALPHNVWKLHRSISGLPRNRYEVLVSVGNMYIIGRLTYQNVEDRQMKKYTLEE